MKNNVTHFLSNVYKAGLKVSQSAYRKVPMSIRKVNARVISIGNITWGGTGKTPFAAKLAGDLVQEGKKVAILTRGYGKDEVLELKKKLPNVPIVVGRDRIKTATEAIKKYGVDFLILDDGFQHIRLHRDLDVVMIDATLPFGPGGLIPAGSLREPIEHLARADVFVLSKSNIGVKNIHWIQQKIHSLKPNAVIFEATHKPVSFREGLRNKNIPLHDFRSHRVVALSGIADPLSFERTLEQIGTEILFAARFDDHHQYRESDLVEVFRKADELGIKEIITTEKDFVKIEPLLKKGSQSHRDRFSVFVLQIEFQLSDEEDFLRRCLNP